jgi:hypothetical protein
MRPVQFPTQCRAAGYCSDGHLAVQHSKLRTHGTVGEPDQGRVTMTDENNGGADWIQAWIEQQREQLRRAGAPGDQSTDKATGDSGAQAARDLGMRWIEAGQSYLQGWQQFAQRAGGSGGEAPPKFGHEMFSAWQSAWVGAASAGEGASQQFADLIARMPALGLAREQTEAWRELLAAQAECQQLEQELRGVWTKVQTEALSLLESALRERQQVQGSNRGMHNYRELYDLWVDCGEQVFARVAHSEAYAKLQAQVGNAVIRLRARQQAVIERGLKYFDLPTRSELNTVHKQIRELRERVTTLEAQLADQSTGARERGQS